MMQAVQERVEGWQGRALSSIGKITLIRSVLSSLSIYMLSNDVIPKSVILKVEQIIRAFLWGSVQGRRAIHLVGWHTVYQSIWEGGLGIHSLLSLREALLARHAARFLLCPDSMWTSMMIARYGPPTIIVAGATPHRHHGLDICREILTWSPLIIPNTRWIVGDGRRIDFITDAWIYDVPLLDGLLSFLWTPQTLSLSLIFCSEMVLAGILPWSPTFLVILLVRGFLQLSCTCILVQC